MPGPRLLVLARHAQPAVDPSQPPHEWPLRPDGEAAARRMAERWRTLSVDVVVSSIERKAVETAVAAADVLGVTFQTGEGLHEYERPFVADRTAFLEQMRAFFDDEAAHRAVERRFSSAVDALVRVHGDRRMAIVAHGVVLSLHLAARYGLDAWATWESLDLPAYAVVDTRTRTLVELVRSV